MEPDADLAAMGRLIGDQNRARMLQVLLSGTPQSGSSLASALGISRSLASAHLKKLTTGGLVRAERHGRQQLYSLAGEQVAGALETLLVIAPATPVNSLRGSARMRSLRFARMCYDHLAGVTGVALTEALTARQAIGETDGAWVLGPQGAAVFGDLGIDVTAVPRRTCMDWTERRNHLAGGLGAALAAELARRDWTCRLEGSRIVTMTLAGSAGLGAWLGLDLARLRSDAAA
jgi:DNA-binding transcriptional ArsR family regulator